MENYEELEIQVIELEDEDIICESNGDSESTDTGDA